MNPPTSAVAQNSPLARLGLTPDAVRSLLVSPTTQPLREVAKPQELPKPLVIQPKVKVTRQKSEKRKYSTQQVEQARSLFAVGHSLRQIEAKTGVNRRSARDMIQGESYIDVAGFTVSKKQFAQVTIDSTTWKNRFHQAHRQARNIIQSAEALMGAIERNQSTKDHVLRLQRIIATVSF
jgi:hypothetical protein